MATTQVKIINIALSRIGVTAISSADEDSPAANAVRAIWDTVYDEVLEAAELSCCRARALLAMDTSEPVGDDWDYQYALPSSPYCLKVISLDPDVPYQVEGRKLLTDYDNSDGTDLLCRYVKRVTDYSQLSPKLAVSIALRLAYHVAPLLSELGANAIGQILQESEGAILDAQIRDGMASYDAGREGQTGEKNWSTAGRS